MFPPIRPLGVFTLTLAHQISQRPSAFYAGYFYGSLKLIRNDEQDLVSRRHLLPVIDIQSNMQYQRLVMQTQLALSFSRAVMIGSVWHLILLWIWNRFFNLVTWLLRERSFLILFHFISNLTLSKYRPATCACCVLPFVRFDLGHFRNEFRRCSVSAIPIEW